MFFSECFFLSTKIKGFFSKIGNNSMRAPGRKKLIFFLVMRGLNLMRALILNREKKPSGLTFEQTVQKVYKQDICGGHLEFSIFVHLLQMFARLSTQVVFVGICRDDFHWRTFYSTPCPSNPSGSL